MHKRLISLSEKLHNKRGKHIIMEQSNYLSREWRVTTLRAELKSRGLKQAGLRRDLVNRLEEDDVTRFFAKKLEEEAVRRAKEKKKADDVIRANKGHLGIVKYLMDLPEESEHWHKGWTVGALRAELKSRRLATHGLKRDLLRRLEEDDAHKTELSQMPIREAWNPFTNHLVDVDRGIANLIQDLFRLNFNILDSSEDILIDENHYVWIKFVHMKDAKKFLRSYIDKRNHILLEIQQNWDMQFHIFNDEYEVRRNVQGEIIPAYYIYKASISFPVDQLKKVEKAFRSKTEDDLQ